MLLKRPFGPDSFEELFFYDDIQSNHLMDVYMDVLENGCTNNYDSRFILELLSHVVVGYLYKTMANETSSSETILKRIDRVRKIIKQPKDSFLYAPHLLDIHDLDNMRSKREVEALFADFLYRTLFKKILDQSQTASDLYQLGIFVLALQSYGSSILQAKKAIKDWLGFSLRHIDGAYNLALNSYGRIDKHDLMNFHIDTLFEYMKKRDSFPQKYARAYEAFVNMSINIKNTWNESKEYQKIYKDLF